MEPTADIFLTEKKRWSKTALIVVDDDDDDDDGDADDDGDGDDDDDDDGDDDDDNKNNDDDDGLQQKNTEEKFLWRSTQSLKKMSKHVMMLFSSKLWDALQMTVSSRVNIKNM